MFTALWCIEHFSTRKIAMKLIIGTDFIAAVRLETLFAEQELKKFKYFYSV